MKYTRLTKEQLEALHEEFARFLATQSIDKKEWETIKAEKPAVAEQELDVFSDLIWENVLSQAQFLEHFSSNHVFLFQCFEEEMHSIIIKSIHPSIDLLTKEGLEWLNQNIFGDEVDIHLGKKKYEEDRNLAIFEMIQQGAQLSEGKFYTQLNSIVKHY
jgi:hypothetical protein